MARQRTATASNNIETIKKDLQKLRSDFLHLGKQVESMASDSGADVKKEVKARIDNFAANVDELISNTGDRGREALSAVGEAGENALNSVEEQVRERPLMALAMALGVGFILSSTMRR